MTSRIESQPTAIFAVCLCLHSAAKLLDLPRYARELGLCILLLPHPHSIERILNRQKWSPAAALRRTGRTCRIFSTCLIIRSIGYSTRILMSCEGVVHCDHMARARWKPWGPDPTEHQRSDGQHQDQEGGLPDAKEGLRATLFAPI